MVRPLSRRLTLERFEDRNVPAPLTWSMDGLGNLTVSGTADPAGLTLTATAPNTFDISDGATPVFTGLVVAGNITINLDASNDLVTLDLTAGGMGGNFTLNAGNGLDIFNYTGAGGIAGNLSLTNVNLSVPVGVVVGGNVTINSSTENLVLPNTFIFTASTVGGNMMFTGGNTSDQFDVVAGSIVGGNVNVMMNNSVGGTNVVDLTSGTVIGGNFTYSGGTGEDSIFLTDVVIGGGVTANMGAAITSGTSNNLSATNAAIGRGLSVIGGTGVDTMSVNATSTVGGSAYFSLGEGANTTSFLGQFGSTSSSFSYSGGSGIDLLTFTPSGGSRVRLTATMGAGADTVAFGASTAPPSYAYIDFGAGADTVTGTINFPFYFLNLP